MSEIENGRSRLRTGATLALIAGVVLAMICWVGVLFYLAWRVVLMAVEAI